MLCHRETEERRAQHERALTRESEDGNSSLCLAVDFGQIIWLHWALTSLPLKLEIEADDL